MGTMEYLIVKTWLLHCKFVVGIVNIQKFGRAVVLFDFILTP
jgi:hypothetical protein